MSEIKKPNLKSEKKKVPSALYWLIVLPVTGSMFPLLSSIMGLWPLITFMLVYAVFFALIAWRQYRRV